MIKEQSEWSGETETWHLEEAFEVNWIDGNVFFFSSPFSVSHEPLNESNANETAHIWRSYKGFMLSPTIRLLDNTLSHRTIDKNEYLIFCSMKNGNQKMSEKEEKSLTKWNFNFIRSHSHFTVTRLSSSHLRVNKKEFSSQ